MKKRGPTLIYSSIFLAIEEINMKIVFTICSNNYIAQAKTLGDSIKRINPEYEFFIGLVDQKSEQIDYENEIRHRIIPVDSIGIPDLNDLWKKYTLVEFNTCVKPFYFQHIINKYPDLDFLFYLDPDTLIFNDLRNLENEFGNESNILLTPHILTPIDLDGKIPFENLFLKYGIYNLGFLGLKQPYKSIEMLDWWKERTFHMGFDRPEQGLFVDQLWFNLVPVIFKNIQISDNLGLNMAPWNLHERVLSFTDGKFFINNNIPLVFYHFSNYKFNEPDIISSSYNRYIFEDNTALQQLYGTYNKYLNQNGIENYSKVGCHYMSLRREYYEEQKRVREIENMRKIMSSPILKTKYYLKKILPKVLIRIYKAIKSKT